MSEQYVQDAGDLRKYRTEIPNIVFHLGLSMAEFVLYSHLKRTAGDSGASWKSTETLAQDAGMGMATVSRAKQSLCEPREALGGKALIEIEERPRSNGGRPYHYITMVDIWPENMVFNANRKSAATSTVEVATSTVKQATSTVEVKKNQSKERTKVEKTAAVEPSTENRNMDTRAANTAAADSETVRDGLRRINEAITRDNLGIPLSGLISLERKLARRGETFFSLHQAWKTCRANAANPVGAFMGWCNEGYLPVASKQEAAAAEPEPRFFDGAWHTWNSGSGWTIDPYMADRPAPLEVAS